MTIYLKYIYFIIILIIPKTINIFIEIGLSVKT